jgi:hypothetical protein
MKKHIIIILLFLLLVTTVSAIDYTEQVYGTARYDDGKPVQKGYIISILDINNKEISNYTMKQNGYIGSPLRGADNIIITVHNKTQNVYLHFAVNNSKTRELFEFKPGETVRYDIVIPGNSTFVPTIIPTLAIVTQPSTLEPVTVTPEVALTPSVAKTPIPIQTPTQADNDNTILLIIGVAFVIFIVSIIAFLIYTYIERKSNEEYMLQED